MLDYGNDPYEWIAKGGKPAKAVGDGMPSYEHEGGKMVVYDLLIAQMDLRTGLRFFPSSYGATALIFPDGLTPAWFHLSEHEDGIMSYGVGEREWRPAIYRLTLDSRMERQGSQTELEWRAGLAEMMHHIHAGKEWTMEQANERADKLLLECLSPQQRLEFFASDGGNFRCRGGATKNLYVIELGNGFDILDKTTMEILVSYCFHPEEWMPSADVALAAKLLLEDPEKEAEVLEGARSNIWSLGGNIPKSEGMVYAERLERELVA